MLEQITARDCDEHVLVVVLQDEQIRGYKILNLARDYAPLLKELAFRMLATDQRLRGRLWRIRARIAQDGNGKPQLLLEARVLDEHDGTARSAAILPVPVENFAWVGSQIATKLGIEGTFQFQVAVLNEDHLLVDHWEAHEGLDTDFVISSEPSRVLRLPNVSTGVATPGPTEVMGRPRDTWLRCVFSLAAFVEFRDAARAETARERSWAGVGNAVLDSDRCCIVIDELVALPGQSGREWIRTRGRDFAATCRRLGDSLCAYLHLHPRTVDGQRLEPVPSGNDLIVAWNISRAATLPCVYPIALFGEGAPDARCDMAVYGYDKGILTSVTWEVLER